MHAVTAIAVSFHSYLVLPHSYTPISLLAPSPTVTSTMTCVPLCLVLQAFTLFLMIMVGVLLTYAVLWYTLKWYKHLEEVTDTQGAAYAADKDPEAGAGEGSTTDMAG